MPLLPLLLRRLETSGFMRVSEFMSLCLLHPEYGYYTRPQAGMFGKDGDFVTSPGISVLFGETVAAWLYAAWERIGAPSRVLLVEAGPGTGKCMEDVLRAAKRLPRFYAALSVVLVEASPSLRRVQAERLAPADVPVSWRDAVLPLPGEEESLPFLLFGNEFPDALPVDQYLYFEGKLYERGIGVRDGALAFVRSPRPLPLADIQERYPGIREGAIIEERPELHRLMRGLARAWRTRKGAALFVDYGYGAPPFLSTLQAVRNHRKVPFLENPGEADVTALVDFGALLREDMPEGVRCSGLLSQRDFLLRYGTAERAEALKARAATETERADIDSRVRRLTSPEEMGTLFKAVYWVSEH
jgi:NADH dehydrogenase [ubiquinone] 1 alpha subcomplex assembly factor 7